MLFSARATTRNACAFSLASNYGLQDRKNRRRKLRYFDLSFVPIVRASAWLAISKFSLAHRCWRILNAFFFFLRPFSTHNESNVGAYLTRFEKEKRRRKKKRTFEKYSRAKITS